ncbi:hypothetical protein BEN71_15220 [Acinetobacter wuhouensis]|nr:hypothetical protein BEN71_15220 [Acinetobacter wuhouensis]
MDEIISGKLFLIFTALFVGIGFYTVLDAEYQSDANFDEYPEDRWKSIFSLVMIILGCICLVIGIGVLIYRIILDFKLI